MSSCGGGACQGRLSYQWTLSVEDPRPWCTVPNFQDGTETGLLLPGIVIKGGALLVNKKYRLQVTVTPNNAASGTASLEFRTHGSPVGGTCSVDPTEGIALKTRFKFSCVNWQDEYLPLKYEFHYKSKYGRNSIISYGHRSTVVSPLPSGPEDKNSIVRVHARIINSLSAEANVTVLIKVIVSTCIRS